MKKLVIALLTGLVLSNPLFSQSQDLTVQSEAGHLYLFHSVVPKENWYSIGRLYNISPKELAPFNGTTLDKPLSIGERLKIPLGPVNFSQDGSKAADETFVALYHPVKDKEPLSGISSHYNNVLVANLIKWNGLGKNQPKAGARLIVGYLKVKPALSALAAKGKDHIAVVSAPTEPDEAVAKKEDPRVENNPVAKEQKKADPPKTTLPENRTANSSMHLGSHSNGGYFVNEYNPEGSKRTGGMAGIFKSTSGWQDGKYYALMNNVPVGTIVKIIAPATQKSVYAKVLGQLPDMKESEGLTIRISSAAASELGEGEWKFNVEVRY